MWWFLGYGTIEYRANETRRPDVHGLIIEVSAVDMERLGDPGQGYMVQDVAVLAETGEGWIHSILTCVHTSAQAPCTRTGGCLLYTSPSPRD